MSERMPQAGLPLALLAGDRAQSTWLESLLESGGYAVLRERTGSHALERARATEPDVIVVDADVPGMSGIELCRVLRNDPRITSSTPIFVSFPEEANREQRLAALRAGAWECITPPHDAEEILLKVTAYARAKLDADRARTDGLTDPLTGLYNRQGLARRARELGSQAFRDHDALACVALALDVRPVEQTAGEPPTNVVVRCVHALKSAARPSDVIGRLSPTEFAILAPGTDAAGARRLAERLAGSIQTSVAASAEPGTGVEPPLRVRCGYEAVANVRYAPIEPVGLLARASAALRTGRVEAGGWLRRFDDGLSASPS